MWEEFLYVVIKIEPPQQSICRTPLNPISLSQLTVLSLLLSFPDDVSKLPQLPRQQKIYILHKQVDLPSTASPLKNALCFRPVCVHHTLQYSFSWGLCQAMSGMLALSITQNICCCSEHPSTTCSHSWLYSTSSEFTENILP